MTKVFYTRRVEVELLQKPHFSGHPAPSGEERPHKVQKPKEKQLSKADKDAQKKQQQQLQSRKPLTKYIIAGNRIANLAITKTERFPT